MAASLEEVALHAFRRGERELAERAWAYGRLRLAASPRRLGRHLRRLERRPAPRSA